MSPSGKTDIVDLRRPPRAAVLFGAEGPGLPDALLARAHTVRIAMAGGFDSLNVATVERGSAAPSVDAAKAMTACDR